MGLVGGLLAGLAALVGCDSRRIAELEEGVATEADVRARFGQPEKVWDEPGGAHTLEYNRNPAGHRNYMVTIGPDGRMSALRQVLTPETFARVQPGLPLEQVRRMLGKPARQLQLPLKREQAWDWRWLEPPNTSMVFTVWFDADQRVVRTATGRDPDDPDLGKGSK
ncbi:MULTISPECIES: outer membrane protein assembly factor BamE [Ramlibacter]|uniref:Outer membrane protein assembly factor BamE n=1 Tax=Ramlibacter pinisoli TaxID=2682844 RepID=A0A6N8IS69_9BURK|nr:MULTISPECIES: outer membrane protein assembly factor BamE [Ramlibacter]MBA2964722.1 outer membrane protein assembly factor BamE [Ramlibacter sp. CGMCC 1.13660]MVQ29687.1 outer membrane protein assembly factor BamE [Ramlibacter pinisoli]